MRGSPLALVMWLVSSALVVCAQVREEWVASYPGTRSCLNHPSAMALDAAGNAYVTGSSDCGGAYATLKYDAKGNQLWLARYADRPGYAGARAIAVDAAANVYVTGYVAAGFSTSSYGTVKYDTDGNQLWAARYEGPAGWGRAEAIAVDAAGNVYVTGLSGAPSTGVDYATIKYDPDGNQLWVARYSSGGTNYVRAIAVDPAGNVYVTGDSNATPAYATVKYDAAGNELWVARYGRYPDNATALALDAKGNVYVTGNSRGILTGSDYVTMKYDPDGNSLWVARYNGPWNGPDAPTALALDRDANIYVTGASGSFQPFYTDYATVKYDPNGNQLWAARHNGPGNSWETAVGVAVDAEGSVYVTGVSCSEGEFGNCRNFDMATIKYAADGEEVWVMWFDGPAALRDSASAIAVDSTRNVYVTGSSCLRLQSRNCVQSEYVTIKYAQE